MSAMRLRTEYNDLPSEIFKEVNAFTNDSTVALLAYDNDDQMIENLMASGSLVTVNSRHGVLTAKHVWKEFKKQAAKVSFCVLGYNHYIHEKLEHLKVHIPEVDIDLCFIEIPPSILGKIRAIKTFYPIEQDKITDIGVIQDYLWVTIGFPLLNLSRENRIVNIFRYYTHLVGHRRIADNWDVIELDVQTINSPPNLPRTFGGMSGGGIWNFNVFFNDDTGERKFFIKKNTQDCVLAGVNYYEVVSEGKVCKISGIGPLSIYCGLTRLVDPPEQAVSKNT
jgi:hypothetical protein